MLTTGHLAERFGISRQAVHARAKARGIAPKRDQWNRCLWSVGDARRLERSGKPGPKGNR